MPVLFTRVFFVFSIGLCGLASVATANPEQDFIEAAMRRELIEMRRIFTENARMNGDFQIAEGPDRGETVLWFAVWWRQWDMVRTILENNPHANVDSAPEEGPNRGVTVLWFAANRQKWDLVRTMLERNFQANIEAAPAEGPNRGATVLWYAANWQQWHIVRTILENNPHAYVDAAPAEGPNLGKTVLWYAANWQQWDFVRTMLEGNPQANIEAAPAEGPNRGATVLWYAAAYQQWDLVKTMLERNPGANVDAAPAEGANRGRSVLSYALNRRQWDIVRAILKNYQHNNVDVLLERPHWSPIGDIIESFAPDTFKVEVICDILERGNLENPFPSLEPMFERVFDAFRRTAFALPDFNNPSAVQEWSNFNIFPRDVRELFALETLCAEVPSLRVVSSHVLMTILSHFQIAFKQLDRDEHMKDIIACQVLQKLCPIDSRGLRTLAEAIRDKKWKERTSIESKKKSLKYKRKWIHDEIESAIRDGILPANLSEEMRKRVVSILCAGTISSITLKWVRGQLRNFHFPQDNVEPAQVNNKRERDEEGSNEESRRNQLRARLTQEVIAGAPILELDEIDARVDEIMGEGPVPMDTDDYDQRAADLNFAQAPNLGHPPGSMKF